MGATRGMVSVGALSLALILGLAACNRDPGTAPDGQVQGDALPTPVDEGVAEAPAAAVPLQDIIQTSAQSVVGISFPAGIERHPGLARELAAYADSARAELQEAVDGLGNDKPAMPYELSLSFETVLDTPRLVVVSADGSRYTGGAHGEPLVARFVWLPETGQPLDAEALIADPDGWKAISQHVRQVLSEQVATRLSSDDLPPAEMQQSLASAGKMIESGTTPEAENFKQFQPLVDTQGRISAVRFVFPPYQVGPYSDGTRMVDVPAAVIAPHVAAQYRELFAP